MHNGQFENIKKNKITRALQEKLPFAEGIIIIIRNRVERSKKLTIFRKRTSL